MTAPFDTTKHERVGRGPKAIRAIALSCSSPIHNQHQGRGTHNPRALHGGYGYHQSGFSLCLMSPVDWRRLARRPFPIHVSARGILLPRLSRKRVCSIPLGHTRAYSATVSACQPTVRNRLPHQRLVNRTADRLHHLSDLSSSPSFDGSKKPWKWRQELGKVIQGRGHFVQGGGCCD